MRVTLSVSALKIVGTDLLLLGTVALIPSLSHCLSLPLYLLEPMRCCLLTGMLLVPYRRNAYALALLLPFVSCLLSGMPTPLLAFVIAVELLLNVALFQLMEKRFPVAVAMLFSILLAKVGYYLLKAWIVAPAVLISTPLLLQCLLVLFYSFLFARLHTMTKK